MDLAESELASGGLSSRAETAYNTLNNQQFSASLGAILRGGGSSNNVADVYAANETGRTRLALLTDQMRLQQINNLMRTREMMRGEQEKEFEFNEWRPWADKAQANAAARQQSENGIWGAIDGIGSSAMGYFGSKYNEKLYDKYFSGGGNGGGGGRMQQPQNSYNDSSVPMNQQQQRLSSLYRDFRTPNFNPNYVEQRRPIDFSYNAPFYYWQ